MALSTDIVIRARDEASSAIGGIGTKLQGLGKIGQNMQNVGKAMSVGITAPVVGLGYDIARTAGQFESSMNQVQALSGATADQFEQMRSQAKELGSSTQFSASQAADSMGFLAAAGFDVEQTMGSLPGVLSLAAATNTDLAKTADAASNILSGYASITRDAGGDYEAAMTRIGDVTSKAFANSNLGTDMQGFAASLREAGPIANAAGLEFEHTAAVIGQLGNAGFQAGPAGTTLKNAISSLINPVGRGAAAIEEMGLQTMDAQGNMLSLTNILGQLEEQGATAAQMIDIFGAEAGPGMSAMLSMGVESLSELETKLRSAGGEADRLADVQMQGFEGQMQALGSAWEGLKLSLADAGFLNAITSVAKSLTDVVQRAGKFAEANPQIANFGVAIAGIAAVAGPALVVVGTLISAVGTVAGALAAIAIGPIAVGLAGAVAVGAAIAANWGRISAFIQPAAAALQGFVGQFMSGLMPGLQSLSPLFSQIGQSVMTIITSLGSNLGSIFGYLASGIGLLMRVGQLVGILFFNLTPLGALLNVIGQAFFSTGTKADSFGQAAGMAIARVIGAVVRLVSMTLRVAAAFASMGAQIVSTVTGIASQMYSAGAQIINQLIAGIKSRIGAVTGAIAGVAAQIRGFFPGSPVKFGPLTAFNHPASSPTAKLMGMAAAGINSNPLSGALNQSLSPSPAAPPAASQGGSMSFGDIHITINGVEGAEDIMGKVQEQFEAMFRDMQSDRARLSYS